MFYLWFPRVSLLPGIDGEFPRLLVLPGTDSACTFYIRLPVLPELPGTLVTPWITFGLPGADGIGICI